MTFTAKSIPDGFHTANVYLIIDNVDKQIAFLQQAFGAQEIYRSVLPDGSIIHAEVKIGDSGVMMGQANPTWGARACTVYLYVDDVDAAFRKAVQAGAKSLGEPKDQFYGDRSGGVEDPCGNFWWVATHVEDVSKEEADRRFAALGHKH
jgi:PhnB protein